LSFFFFFQSATASWLVDRSVGREKKHQSDEIIIPFFKTLHAPTPCGRDSIVSKKKKKVGGGEKLGRAISFSLSLFGGVSSIKASLHFQPINHEMKSQCEM
jgi:hypothetical protein